MSFTLLSSAFKEVLLVMIHYVADSEEMEKYFKK